MLRSQLYEHRPSYRALSGGNKSLAASFDYALSKEPMWLIDVFGADKQGRAIARRMFHRINPERKRPGPVSLLLNEQFFAARNVRFILDDVVLSTSAELEELLQLLEGCVGSSDSAEPSGPAQVESLGNGMAATDFLRDAVLALSSGINRDRRRIQELGDGSAGFIVKYNSLSDFDSQLSILLDVCYRHTASEDKMYWYLKHPWWPLLKPVDEYKRSKQYTPGCQVMYVTPSDTVVDRTVAGLYEAIGIQSKLGAPKFLENDTWVTGPYIITLRYPEGIEDEMDSYFRSARTSKQFNIAGFMRRFLDVRGDFSVEVRFEPQATRIGQQVERYFEAA